MCPILMTLKLPSMHHKPAVLITIQLLQTLILVVSIIVGRFVFYHGLISHLKMKIYTFFIFA